MPKETLMLLKVLGTNSQKWALASIFTIQNQYNAAFENLCHEDVDAAQSARLKLSEVSSRYHIYYVEITTELNLENLYQTRR